MGFMMITTRKSLAFVCVAVAFFVAATANAATVRCDFTTWKGAQTEAIAISWVGVGFEVQEDRARLRVLRQSGASEWLSVDIRNTSRFTTYVVNLKQSDSSGANYDNRYGFRVYSTGRCETLLTTPGYVPIEGKGRVR